MGQALHACTSTRVVESEPGSGLGPRTQAVIASKQRPARSKKEGEREIESQLPWVGRSRGLAGTSETKSHIGDEIGVPPRVLRLEWDGSKFGR